MTGSRGSHALSKLPPAAATTRPVGRRTSPGLLLRRQNSAARFSWPALLPHSSLRTKARRRVYIARCFPPPEWETRAALALSVSSTRAPFGSSARKEEPKGASFVAPSIWQKGRSVPSSSDLGLPTLREATYGDNKAMRTVVLSVARGRFEAAGRDHLAHRWVVVSGPRSRDRPSHCVLTKISVVQRTEQDEVGGMNENLRDVIGTAIHVVVGPTPPVHLLPARSQVNSERVVGSHRRGILSPMRGTTS